MYTYLTVLSCSLVVLAFRQIDGTRSGADETLEDTCRGVAQGHVGAIFIGSGRFFSALEGRDWWH